MRESEKENFLKTLADWSLPRGKEKIAKMEMFAEMIASAGLGLVSGGDIPRIFTRHILDSLALLKFAKELGLENFGVFVDVGSGAGLPGVPLKIFLPEKKFVLVEPGAKRRKFLHRVAAALNLKNTEVESRPVESPDCPEGDVITQRAVGRLEDILEACLKKTREGGIFCAWRSGARTPADEIPERIMLKYNVKIPRALQYVLPGENKKRHILVFGREKCTT